jgi:hypothetical protein
MGVPSWIDNEVIQVMKDRRAIQRVRKLVDKFEQEAVDEMVNYHLVARRILIALDCEE